jgi:hypothetical protein
VATLRTSDKIRVLRSASIVPLGERLCCLCDRVLGSIAEVNDPFWLTKRPTDVESCALVAVIGGYSRVTA